MYCAHLEAAHLAAARMDSDQGRCVPGDSGSVWCPLHRELNVTDEQWSQIEPLLRTFRAEADEICGQIRNARAEIIVLLAATDTDMDAVKVKQEDVFAGQRKMQSLVIRQLTRLNGGGVGRLPPRARPSPHHQPRLRSQSHHLLAGPRRNGFPSGFSGGSGGGGPWTPNLPRKLRG